MLRPLTNATAPPNLSVDHAQQRLEFRIRNGFHRRVGQFDQGAVEIQKQTPFERRRRRRYLHHVQA